MSLLSLFLKKKRQPSTMTTNQNIEYIDLLYYVVSHPNTSLLFLRTEGVKHSQGPEMNALGKARL